MNNKGKIGIIILITIIVLLLSIVAYFLFSNGDNSNKESNIDVFDEIERSIYYRTIENIEDYLGEELIFENVNVEDMDWGNTKPYHIKIIEDNGDVITLPIIGYKSLTHMSLGGKYIIKGIVGNERRGYFLNVTEDVKIYKP